METVKIIENKSEIGAAKWGAGMGIDALKTVAKTLQDPFFGQYPNVKIQDENDTLFEETPYRYARRIDKILSLCSRLSHEVAEVMKEGKYFPVVISGDHSPAAGTIAGIRKANPGKRIGVIWIDAHADLHSPYTSPSGNIHGMPLAAALQEDNLACKVNEPNATTLLHWNNLKNVGTPDKKLLAQDLIYFGLRDFEAAEAHIIEKEEVSCYKVEELRFRGLEVCVKEAVEQLQDCDHIYISFDVDSMDCDHVSTGTGTPVPIGFFAEEIVGIFDQLFLSNKLVCIELTEVNPLLDNKGNLMAETAFMVLDHVAKKI